MLAEARRLSEQQWQVVLGSLMGDGNLSPEPPRPLRRPLPARPRRQAGGLPRLEGLRCSATSRYSRRVDGRGAVFADFTPLPELDELRRAVYLGDGKKHLSEDYLKALTPLALAVWYMDDGGFTLRSKGLQQRTAGRQRPDRDLRRGDERGHPGAARRATCATRTAWTSS